MAVEKATVEAELPMTVVWGWVSTGAWPGGLWSSGPTQQIALDQGLPVRTEVDLPVALVCSDLSYIAEFC